MGESRSWQEAYRATVPECGPSWQTKKWIAQTVRGSFLVFVVFIFLAGWFGKAEWSGWHDYASFFTNWSWSTQAIFYILVCVGTFIPTVRHVAILLLFMPSLVTSIFVWIMLQIIVASDPTLLDIMNEIPGRVFEIGNELYHSWPMFLNILFAFFFYQTIRHVYKSAWDNANIPILIHLLNGIWQIYFPLILAGVYGIANNPMEVYGIVNVSFGFLLTVGIIVNTIVGGIFFLYLFPYTSHYPSFDIMKM